MAGDTKTRKELDVKLVLITLFMSILILISGIQAVELTNLKNKIKTLDEVTLTKQQQARSLQSTQTTKQSDLLQQNLQNLPGMVGGC